MAPESVPMLAQELDYAKSHDRLSFTPFESQDINDQPSAQTHYEFREIKLRRQGDEPHITTYTDHYPPKKLPMADYTPPPDDGAPTPFQGTSTYQNHFPPKSLPPPSPPNIPTMEGVPVLDPFPNDSTYMRDYQGKRLPMPEKIPEELDVVLLPKPPPLMSTNQRVYKKPVLPPRPVRPRPDTASQPPAPTNWNTSYNISHKWPPLPPQKQVAPVEQLGPNLPFEGITTYNTYHTPKYVAPDQSHPKGWRLPYPRPSLGVEYVGHRLCFKDRMFTLIHKSQGCPATGKQIFTTVRDNQTECCILVLAGDDSQSSKNMLLGQFDLVGIPPAPMDVPQIEVTFKVRAHEGGEILEVEAHDLDTGRNKEWIRSGGGIVIRDSAHVL
mmetsp:Transcript_19373/g.37097  ORF Transcript_19373/g.37097 Transcript_19373/m.37097 type:complete len:383 (-) Transcript_19373:1105-2253(-)|eukprot:CAMPEP_0114237560 /NCGR_PEP_ID=MMETSP0058-20121206/7457_1 /TAXON_ID=36894 /ORGANISM="Pyramimonas parkeae, CCMP726" /LENGTH=382 /DNA_ID=CAMNT_0001349613 /DNA_START=136 /DNA_END=1284 /DNA_ORIENTATION=-